VSEDVWAQQDTTPDAIEAAMRDLLRQRHAANEQLAPARVLNMVVILDREWKGEIYNRLEHVGRYHASRTVLCAVEEGRKTLDAVATVSYQEPTNGVIGAMHEQVEIDLGPEHIEGLRTIVDPVLVTELPTVLWSPHGHEQAVRELLPQIDVMLIDSDDAPEPEEGFEMARQLADEVYLVDLAWLRTTPWRERLAASFDVPDRLPCLPHLSELEVRHRGGSTASGLLLAGWLATRLHWDRMPLRPDGASGVLSGVARRNDDEEVELRLLTTHQEVPGLVGVTVGSDGGFSLSLQRGVGGLDAEERWVDGSTREWKILGASRGEAGILGEGIRQALLREPTYAPALRAARELCPA
jgi:glucose-6-phosphate dehydrogenase assembly protein OpcA